MKGLALLAALPLLAACTDPGAPNGERGVLFFEPEFLGAVGESLSLSITMPRHVTLGDYPKSIDRVEHYDYDFDGTVLEFPEASGLAVLDTTLDDQGWHMKVQCTSPATAPAHLRVSVRARDVVRYEDATEVTCRQGQKLQMARLGGAPGTDPPFDFPHYVIGANTNAVQLAWLDETGASLFGHGVRPGSVVLNPLMPSLDEIPGLYSFKADVPGQATVVMGDTSFDLPFDVVSDDSWSFELAPLPDAGSGPLLGVNARLADGTLEPVGQSCTLNATASDGTPLVLSFGLCAIAPPAGHGQICITIRDKSGCVDF